MKSNKNFHVKSPHNFYAFPHNRLYNVLLRIPFQRVNKSLKAFIFLVVFQVSFVTCRKSWCDFSIVPSLTLQSWTALEIRLSSCWLLVLYFQVRKNGQWGPLPTPLIDTLSEYIWVSHKISTQVPNTNKNSDMEKQWLMSSIACWEALPWGLSGKCRQEEWCACAPGSHTSSLFAHADSCSCC